MRCPRCMERELIPDVDKNYCGLCCQHLVVFACPMCASRFCQACIAQMSKAPPKLAGDFEDGMEI